MRRSGGPVRGRAGFPFRQTRPVKHRGESRLGTGSRKRDFRGACGAFRFPPAWAAPGRRRAGSRRARPSGRPARGLYPGRPEADGQRHARAGSSATPRPSGDMAMRHGKRPGSDKAASWGVSENKYRTSLGGWQGIVGELSAAPGSSRSRTRRRRRRTQRRETMGPFKASHPTGLQRAESTYGLVWVDCCQGCRKRASPCSIGPRHLLVPT